MNSDQKRRIRRMSMQGTVLFALGIIGAVVSVVMGSVWIACGAVILLAAAIVMLYRVGRSLS